MDLIHQLDDTVVVNLPRELGAMDWKALGELTDELQGHLIETKVKDVVVDLSQIELIGSETIGFLIRLRSIAAEVGGRVSLFGASQFVTDTLATMKLGEPYWHICSKRCVSSPAKCSQCPEFVSSCYCDESGPLATGRA